MSDIPLTIGGRIQTLRKAKSLGLEPLAKAAGITVSALSQIESGTTKNPKPANLFAIADALDADPRYLVFGHTERVAPSLSRFPTTDTGRFRMRRK